MTYTYGNPDWQDELTGISTVTGSHTVNEQVTYDNNGNALSYRGATLAWNGKQLTSWTKGSDSISYAYDENGLRLNKTVNGTRTDYYYNGSLLMSMVSGDDTLLFSYDQGGNVVSVNHNGTEYYYLRNGQGDIIKIIDGSGTAVVTYGYDSWGRLISCDGSLATTLGTLNPFRYRGYVYDEETQLYYLQSRYYDPSLCRFISSDVLLSTGQGVIGNNSFAYCNNRPANCVDSCGTYPVAAIDIDDYDTVIFYTDYDETENAEEGHFTKQAEFYSKFSKSMMIKTNTVEEFCFAWKGLRGHYKNIFIFSHGNGTSLIFYDGKGISATGKDKNGNPITAISSLDNQKLMVDSLYLMSCNSGHIAQYKITGVNTASAMASLSCISKVYSFDGSMAYGDVLNNDIYFARLSRNQSSFHSLCKRYGGRRIPKGWVTYE